MLQCAKSVRAQAFNTPNGTADEGLALSLIS